MSTARNRFINLALAAGAVLFVLVVSIVGDRAVGVLAAPQALPGSKELIFPPNAKQSFKSIEFEYTANINQLGLRDREVKPKERGVYRICAIGDSYTYGWGVAAEETWLRKLEETLNAQGLKVETINMGKPGAGPPDYSKLAAEALPLLEPDLVIVGILMGNDIIAAQPDGAAATRGALVGLARTLYPNLVRIASRPRVSDEARTQETPPQVSSATDNQQWTRNTAQEFLKNMSPEQRARYDKMDPKVREGFENGLFNPYMVDLATKSPDVYNHTLRLEDPWLQSTIGAVAAHVALIRDAAANVGAKVVVAPLPDGPYVNDAAWRNIQRVGYEVPEGMVDSDAPDTAVRRAAEEAGVDFLSATDVFKQHRGDAALFFEFDGHLSAQGHALFAEALAPQVAALVR